MRWLAAGLFVVASVTLVSLVASLIVTPLFYRSATIGMGDWQVLTIWDALAFCAIGLLLLPIALHLLNGVAWASSALARYMLAPAGNAARPEPTLAQVAQTA